MLVLLPDGQTTTFDLHLPPPTPSKKQRRLSSSLSKNSHSLILHLNSFLSKLKSNQLSSTLELSRHIKMMNNIEEEDQKLEELIESWRNAFLGVLSDLKTEMKYADKHTNFYDQEFEEIKEPQENTTEQDYSQNTEQLDEFTKLTGIEAKALGFDPETNTFQELE